MGTSRYEAVTRADPREHRPLGPGVIGGEHLVTDAISILLTGMTAVLVVLTVLWLSTLGLGRLFGTALPARARAKAAVGGGASSGGAAAGGSGTSNGGPAPALAAGGQAVPRASSTTEAPAGIPPHHLAAISAAVAAMSSGATRITVRAPALVASAWADYNRYERSTTHRVRFDWPTTIRGPRPIDTPRRATNDRARPPQQREE